MNDHTQNQSVTQAGAGSTATNRLTSEKSGIVTSSRSRGRTLLLAVLLKKLATELQLSCSSHQGAKHNNHKLIRSTVREHDFSESLLK